MTPRFRLARTVLAIGFVVVPLALPAATLAQTPAASPAALPALPQGPLGEQIGWMVDLLNGPPEEVTVEEIEAHLTPEFLAEVSAAEVAAIIGEVAGFAPFVTEENTIITTLDLPPTNGRLVMTGADGTRVELAISIDRESGLISGLLLQPVPPEASPDASPAP